MAGGYSAARSVVHPRPGITDDDERREFTLVRRVHGHAQQPAPIPAESGRLVFQLNGILIASSRPDA